MKKYLTLGLAFALASVASAVTMNWGASNITFEGTKLKNDATVTGYLIALDSLSSTYTLTDSFTANDVGSVLDSKNKTSAVSKITNDWSIDTTNYSNGDTFAVLLKYTGASDGKTYWNLTSGLVTMSGMSTDPPTDAADTTSAFSFAKATGNTLTAGGGWTAVPEPSIACMALLGIGMMLKRRRA